MRYEDKTVLILGGNSGIGLASVEAFAREGARVLLTGRNQATIDAAVERIPGARGYQADIADLSAMEALANNLQEEGVVVDALFINAGIGGFAPVRDVTPELWDEIHSINLRGCFFAIQKMLPLLGQGGAIVITGSIGSDVALAGNVVYAAAKAGLKAVMRILAKELVEEGVRVNMVSPGPIETPLINRNVGMSDEDADKLREAMISVVPMRRLGEASEVASAVLFLAAQDASFITGVELLVDGGSLELR